MYSRRSIIESGLLGIPRSTLGYELRMPAKDRPVIDAMKLLSSQYSRYGYRGIRIFLKRQGHQLGWHRAHGCGTRLGCNFRAAARSGASPAAAHVRCGSESS